ncbi:L-xylulose reductase-like [Argiope bruennichi]|uniref:L-xylulose reductase like protein n=1 Tax=Argiope bruennichi TaxID=94029 RepID=A0A8T0ED62_ARGBR|nr:L-xylulose reductase-like [Argiope bruennichi]XP_055953814.1 L-xylulose reductase-like [Argiope bruennichi]KAF8770667.1 L-xylulose reductase like protein [Argiope bruennichi]
MLNGKRALVTGAGRGIGRSLAIELAKRGAHVIALSRTMEHLITLKNEIPAIEIVSVDVANWKETENVVKRLGPIDLLVNNAGIASLEEVGKITEESFDNVFAVNVKAVVNISQIVAEGMKQRGNGGSIVNISSQAALVALPQHATYCASKGALDQLTKVMALELGPFQIRVNSVNPTVVLTEMGIKAWGEENKAKATKAKIPLGKFCDPEDVVKAVIFLLSDDAGMITGAQLPIDGGYTIH